MLRQLQEPKKDFQEPFVPAVSGVEAGGTQALGHRVHKDHTCWPDKQGLEKREKALGSDQLPTHRAADGQGENTSSSPLETAAGKPLCREEHGEQQPLRHQDAKRIWEYSCEEGRKTATVVSKGHNPLLSAFL